MTYLKVNIKGGVYEIQLNRPHKHHALTIVMLSELCETLKHAFENESIKIITLKSSGKVFCAGADLTEMHEQTDGLVSSLVMLIKVLQQKNKPIFVSLGGNVYGGGSILLGFADVIFALDSVKVVMPEIKSDLWPVLLLPILKRHLPPATLAHMAMNAEPLYAKNAYDLGWFSALFNDINQLEDKLEDTLKQYCCHSKLTLNVCFECYRDTFSVAMKDEDLDKLGMKLIQLVRVKETNLLEGN